MYADLERQYGCALDRAAIRTRRRERHAELIAGEIVRAGVAAYLADARRLGPALGVASSSERVWVEGHLARLGLRERFGAVVCREDVAVTKPSPDFFLRACTLLGVKPDEAVALEDAPHGVTAAKAAGLFCVAVPNDVTRSLDLDHADVRLDSLAEMSLAAVPAAILQHDR